MKLSYTACENAKPGDKAYKMSDGRGMFMEVRPNGAKYWRMRYRYNGKQKLLALGVYPDVSLKLAREKREDARKLLENGVDPSQHKQESRRQAQLNAANTFEAIAREWHDNNKHVYSQRHAQTILYRLDKDIFPAIGNYPIQDITPPVLLESIRKIEARGAHDYARRCMQVCGQVFRYAIATGRAERDPTADLKGALKPYRQGHYPALDIKELPEFLETLDKNDMRLYPATRLAVHFMMLTFVRTSELINAQWQEIDFEAGEWHIPKERMKMRKDHIVPLSRQALDVLRELHLHSGHRDYLFPGQQNPRKPMSNGTILGAIKRMGYGGRMTGHGFRALAMSAIKEKLGYRHEVIDRQLAHAHRNKVDAAYDRAQFLDERKQMMQAWADYLSELGR